MYHFFGKNSFEKGKDMKQIKQNIGFFFVLPWLIGFLLFKVYPFASSLYYSFSNYDMFSGKDTLTFVCWMIAAVVFLGFICWCAWKKPAAKKAV